MTRLVLDQVTMLAVDTRSPALALAALEHSCRQVRFARALLLTSEAGAALPRPAGIDAAVIAPITSSAGYSDFVLRELPAWVATSHVLVVQWDGFVADASAWDPAFLDCDYLGAPWGKAADERCVGNGGFSLRSRRLLQALQDPALRERWHHPEDLCIGQTLRPELEARHGIVFGTREQAARFAFENEAPTGPAFGFHAAANLARVLPLPALQALVPALPDDVVAGRDGFKLARALLRAGQPALAAPLLARRIALGQGDLRTRFMALRAATGRRASG